MGDQIAGGGRQIKLFLVDGSPAGIITAEVVNWTGKALSPSRSRLGQLIRRLAGEWGLAVLLIEHDVELVTSVSDRVVALELGAVIAEGQPEQVMRSPAVMASYLGLSADDDAAGPVAHPAPVSS